LNFIRHKDWLGSSRLATTWAHAVYAKEAYAPFGETYNEAGTADRSFTGQDQNVVTNSGGTGVYDYLFRKYDPSAGRWLSPDPYGWGAVSLHRPQSLNRYAYVQNGPLTLIDPDGTSIGCDDEDGCDSGDGDLGEGDIPGFSPAPPDPGPTPPWDTPALDPDPGAFFDGGAGLSYDNGYRGDDDPSICDLASGCFEYYLQTQMWPASSATVEVASAPNNGPTQQQQDKENRETMLAFCAGMKANAEAAGDRGEFLGGLAGILAGLAWKTESPIAAGGAAVSGILSGANIMDKYMLRLEARAMSCPK
jgi:RHS repeat-associated protein